MPNENTSAIAIQKRVRGHLTRQHIKVKTLSKGVIHIQIRGCASLFEKIGIFDIDSTRPSRSLDVLSINLDDFEGRAVGGQHLFNPLKETHCAMADMFGSDETIYINAGFFNANGFYKDYPLYTPVGPTKTSSAASVKCIPIPQDYKKDYGTLIFKNGTYVSAAPILTRFSKPVFDDQNASDPRYQLETIGKAGDHAICPPGALFHVSEPNPRAGIAIDEDDGLYQVNLDVARHERVRLAVAVTTSRGPHCNGFTMFEWRNTMTRLSQLNLPRAGHALNLDGGASVVLGVACENNKTLEVSQSDGGRDSSTFIVFSRK